MSPGERHRVRAADGVWIALHHLRPRHTASAHPVLLVPGTFSTRSFWFGTRGRGFGRFLAEAGHDVWVVELRGHGASQRPRRWSMHEWIRLDAPAAIAAVLRESGAESCFWVGHSAGGVVGAGAVGHDPGLARCLRGLVLLGAPGPAGLVGLRRLGARAAHLAASLLPWGALPGEPFGLGPEPEPARLIREWLHWNLLGIWRTPEGGDYLAGLRQVDVPMLAVAGAGDRVLAPPPAVRDLALRFGSPDRTLVVAGKRQGYLRDYGHAGLVVSREARDDVWPLVLRWLREHEARRRTDPDGTSP